MKKISLVQPALFRGPQPRGLLPMLRAQYGITDVVCLQRGWYDAFNELLRGRSPRLNELQHECDQSKVGLVLIPCSDFRAPSAAQTQTFLNFGRDAIAEGRVVYFHCLHGVDRTGWMAAAWRVKFMGWTVEDALEEYDRMGRHAGWYRSWPAKFREVIQVVK